MRSYAGSSTTSTAIYPARRRQRAQALPPISSYAFADILKAADCPDLQKALDGIAEICAKNRMSLADEYSSHLPPLGEITAASTTAPSKPHLVRPGLRPALTSVPEGSSGSSEGSRKSKKRTRSLFGFGWQKTVVSNPLRKVRIGSMGRTIDVGTTTAVAEDIGAPSGDETDVSRPEGNQVLGRQRSDSAATISLQRLLEAG